jgi:hypothetical protein
MFHAGICHDIRSCKPNRHWPHRHTFCLTQVVNHNNCTKCLQQHMQRQATVGEALEIVELDTIQNQIVGIPGTYGLSGEQFKRLTIAVELVANPSIIFCGAHIWWSLFVHHCCMRVALCCHGRMPTLHATLSHICAALPTGCRFTYIYSTSASIRLRACVHCPDWSHRQ